MSRPSSGNSISYAPAGGVGTSLFWYQAIDPPKPTSVWWRSLGASVTTAA